MKARLLRHGNRDIDLLVGPPEFVRERTREMGVVAQESICAEVQGWRRVFGAVGSQCGRITIIFDYILCIKKIIRGVKQ